MTVIVEASVSGRKVYASGSIVFDEKSSLTLNIGGFPLILRFLPDPAEGNARLNIQNEIGVTTVEVFSSHIDAVSFGLRPFKVGGKIYELNIVSSLLTNDTFFGHRTVHYTVLDPPSLDTPD